MRRIAVLSFLLLAMPACADASPPLQLEGYMTREVVSLNNATFMSTDIRPGDRCLIHERSSVRRLTINDTGEVVLHYAPAVAFSTGGNEMISVFVEFRSGETELCPRGTLFAASPADISLWRATRQIHVRN